jgi:hypothetical protein
MCTVLLPPGVNPVAGDDDDDDDNDNNNNNNAGKGKRKGRFHLKTDHEGPDVGRCIALLFLQPLR